MKYFVCSDIHSFFNLWQEALSNAGYDKNNENHTLIVCGDIFDRGDNPIAVYEFLKSIPKERRILIRGNHEYLLRDLYERKFVMKHDFHNKTNDTLAYFNNLPTLTEFELFLHEEEQEEEYEWDDSLSFEERMKVIDEKMERLSNKRKEYESKLFKDNKLAEEIIEWIFSDEWVDYYELDKYIFVHAFIPLHKDMSRIECNFIKEYKPDWRTNATKEEWEEATWGCPYKLYLQFFDKEKANGKVLVCGHWHTFDFFEELKGIAEVIYDIYYSKNLIALDGCTAYSNQCNVMVIDEDMKCYQYNKLLVEPKSRYPKTKK